MKVLMISHEASRSGAPRIAVLVVSCLVDAGHTVQVVSQRPGPLVEDFSVLAPTRVHPCWRLRARLWLLPMALARRVAILDQLLALLTILRSGCDVVYINTSSATHYLRPALWARRRVVLHVHESRVVCRDLMTRCGAGVVADLPASVVLVACSPSVAADLSAAGAAPDAVHLIPSVPDSRLVLAAAAGSVDVEPGPVVVGACGSVEHRKGVDLWMAVARTCRERLGDAVVFRWVGGGVLPADGDPPEGVELAGEVPDPGRHMAAFDVMTLPSRDDPFPLVVVEAMLLGKPVVAFDVGGVAEQLGGTGVLVPPNDVMAFSDAVCRLVADRSARRRLGDAARSRAFDTFSVEAFNHRLVRVMDATSPDSDGPADGWLSERDGPPAAPRRRQAQGSRTAQQP